jgi:hypothetical protein
MGRSATRAVGGARIYLVANAVLHEFLLPFGRKLRFCTNFFFQNHFLAEKWTQNAVLRD